MARKDSVRRGSLLLMHARPLRGVDCSKWLSSARSRLQLAQGGRGPRVS